MSSAGTSGRLTTSGARSTVVRGGARLRTAREATPFGQVLEHGLASLAEHWQLRRTEEAEAEVVCIQEADPTGVTLALGYYSLPGVPTMRVTRSQLDAGEWVLER